jgi:hypothetical protein
MYFFPMIYLVESIKDVTETSQSANAVNSSAQPFFPQQVNLLATG